MKIIITLIGWVAMALILAGCGNSASKIPEISSAEDTVKIMVASDLHYLSPKLTDHGEAFVKAIESSDGKVMMYIEELTDAFVDKVIEEKPDVLILSGDLTFNGEMESHNDFITKLSKVEDAGIPVLVIPGNHDIDNRSAALYRGDSVTSQTSITKLEFRKKYKRFGPEECISQDANSFSYMYAVRSDLRILMLDTNSDNDNTASRGTLKWMRTQLEEAREAGARVITVSHQNTHRHNSVFWQGFVINNYKDVETLYEEFGVLCNFSGHMHMQHIARDGVPEVATSALSLSPNQYGIITYDGQALRYENVRLSVSEWAKKNGSKDSNLLDFETYARDFFRNTTIAQNLEILSGTDLSEHEKETMAESFMQLNCAYFAGDPVDTKGNCEGIDLWESQSRLALSRYVMSIVSEEPANHHSLTVEVTEPPESTDPDSVPSDS